MRRRNICCYSLLVVFLFVTAFNIFMMRSIPQALPSNVWKKRPISFSSLPSDSTGKYKIWGLFKENEGGNKDNGYQATEVIDITLITQTSVWNLPDLVEMSGHWSGKISVGVFAPGEEIETALEYIMTMRICQPKIKNSVSFNVVMALSHPPLHNNLAYYIRKSESYPRVCGGSIESDDKRRKKNYANERRVPYPVNLLRNVAVAAATTSHVLVIDVDMLPTPNLREDFQQHFTTLPRHDGVYVLPTFELKEHEVVPRSKEELMKVLDDGNARPFYKEVCWKCQKYTEYDRWKRLEMKGLSVGYKVEWHDPWEPFFIAEKKGVHYDERFKQYGFNRISQVCETHYSGKDFFVLDNAFLVHRGFKEKEAFHQSKDAENARNRIIFRTFKRELKQKYPQSDRHC